MYKPINGYTKAKIIEAFKARKNVKSIGDSCCYYRGPNGTKCAVGVFIPDDKYDPAMETDSACGIIRRFDLSEIIPLPAPALGYLQEVHDESESNDINAELIAWVETNVQD